MLYMSIYGKHNQFKVGWMCVSEGFIEAGDEIPDVACGDDGALRGGACTPETTSGMETGRAGGGDVDADSAGHILSVEPAAVLSGDG